jgi:AraC family transcriptional regulator
MGTVKMDRRDQEVLDKQQNRGGLPPYARRRVHDYIAAHLDQKITNDALAQIAGISTYHFCTVFKQTDGMSLHRYVLQCRVQRTQQLLTSTEMSLTEIADAVGFFDLSHCINRFREIVGVTPGDYRRCSQPGSSSK